MQMNFHIDHKVMLVAKNIWRNWSLNCQITCFILSNTKAISFFSKFLAQDNDFPAF